MFNSIVFVAILLSARERKAFNFETKIFVGVAMHISVIVVTLEIGPTEPDNQRK